MEMMSSGQARLSQVESSLPPSLSLSLSSTKDTISQLSRRTANFRKDDEECSIPIHSFELGHLGTRESIDPWYSVPIMSGKRHLRITSPVV